MKWHTGAQLRGVFIASTLLLLAMPILAVRAQNPAPAQADSADRKPIRGRLIDESGRPVEGAMVAASLIGSSGNYNGAISAVTNREGVFATAETDPGLYRLWVQAAPLVVVDGIPSSGAIPGQAVTIRMARGAAISGKVVDREGQPLTGLTVEPVQVADGKGVKQSDEFWGYRGGQTDDRGIYRIWGLEPGTYVLAAGHSAKYDQEPKFLSDRVRTFHPSSNRAAATEVNVRSGDDVGNVDITFRGDTGFRISGTVAGVRNQRASPNTSVELRRPGTTATERYVSVQTKGDALTFRFESLEDGEYEVIAWSWDGEKQESSTAATVRVRGADVTGVRLELQPTSTVTGRIEVKSPGLAQTCQTTAGGKAPPPLRLGEMTVRFRRVEAKYFREGAIGPKADGEFTAKNLNGTLYRLGIDFADDDAYLESLDRTTGSENAALPAGTKRPPVKPDETKLAAVTAIARDGVILTRGATVSGVRFVVTRGAARVRGRIAPAKAGESLPSRSRVCLVPADPKQKDDVIHFYEVEVERDGTFDVRNVAPGEYLVATRVFPNDDRPDAEIFPASWDPKERAALRAAAEKLGIRVTLSPCQRLESAVITIPSMP